MKIEKLFGHDVRFIEHENEWYAVCKDICKALNADELDAIIGKTEGLYLPIGGDENSVELVLNEIDIYNVLFTLLSEEGLNFRIWSASIMKKLRELAGLKGYEVFKLTDADIQKKIDGIIDTLYYDVSTDQIMVSVTVAGGDVEQIPLYSY